MTTGRRALVKQAEGASAFPKDYEQFRGRLAIDRDNIDKCVEEQASVFHEVFERHVLATSERDDCRDELAREDATIAREFRRKAAEANEKCTEATVTDAVLLHPKHIALNEKLAGLKRACDLWYSLREAFEQRVRMLHELVALYTQEYYGSTSAGAVNRQNRDAMAEQGRRALAESRKKS